MKLSICYFDLEGGQPSNKRNYGKDFGKGKYEIKIAYVKGEDKHAFLDKMPGEDSNLLSTQNLTPNKQSSISVNKRN